MLINLLKVSTTTIDFKKIIYSFKMMLTDFVAYNKKATIAIASFVPSMK